MSDPNAFQQILDHVRRLRERPRPEVMVIAVRRGRGPSDAESNVVDLHWAVPLSDCDTVNKSLVTSTGQWVGLRGKIATRIPVQTLDPAIEII